MKGADVLPDESARCSPGILDRLESDYVCECSRFSDWRSYSQSVDLSSVVNTR